MIVLVLAAVAAVAAAIVRLVDDMFVLWRGER